MSVVLFYIKITPHKEVDNDRWLFKVVEIANFIQLVKNHTLE